MSLENKCWPRNQSTGPNGGLSIGPGYAFHADNPKQLERDKMKDRILKKYGIPILRIGTNESGEEKRLHKKLSQVLNQEDRLVS